MIGIDEIEERIQGRSVGDESCFWTRAGRGFRDGLARMAELAPDDPFWAGTNRQVTEYKLGPFCETLLQRDPRDRGALWAKIGWDVRCCSNELQEQDWRTLLDLGDFQPQWLVEHALWVELVSGVDTAPLVGETLRRHQLIETTRAGLLLLKPAYPPYSEQWVERVIALTL